MEQKYVFNETKAREIDRDIVNKWRNDWLAGQDKLNRPFSAWLRKLDEPGTAYCLVCNKKLLYRSNGKKSFQSHVVDPEHVAAINSQQHTSTLPTAEPVIADACLSDRVTSAKLRICAFLAEHCLPFSLSPDLIDLIKTLGSDQESCKKLSMCRKTASYTLTHGLARSVKLELHQKLKTTYFSINLDESTDNAGRKIVNVLVRFYDDAKGEVVTQLLGSYSESHATSANLFAGLAELLDQDSDPEGDPDCSDPIPWTNVVSCLLDNCNTMRGKNSGLETLIRNENANLLDVHGDTVHIVSNIAKEFCQPFNNYLESLASDVYYDFKLSPKAKALFIELCNLLDVESPMVFHRPVGSRFLQMLDVTDRIHHLWEPLLVFYFGFLTSSEQKDAQ